MRRISENPSIKIESSAGIGGAAVYFYALKRNGVEVSIYSVRKDKSVFEGEDWKDIPKESRKVIKDFVDAHAWDELWNYAEGK